MPGPGFTIWLVQYFLPSFRLTHHHNSRVECSLVCVESQGRISWSVLTQDIKMGSCVFQFDVPHQWIAQRQVDPVSVYCDRVGVTCPVSAAWHSCVAPLLQAGTITIWPQMFKSDVKPKQTNKLIDALHVAGEGLPLAAGQHPRSAGAGPSHRLRRCHLRNCSYLKGSYLCNYLLKTT